MKFKITSKAVLVCLAFATLALLATSCSRGGSGCPYELQAATDVISNLR